MIPTTHIATRHYPTRKPTQAAYHAALELVAQIDEGLTRNTGHYYTKSGRLLRTLDEVIRAILSGDLMGTL